MKDFDMRLDIGQVKIDDLANTSYDALRDKCTKNRLPPLSPDKFELKLRQEKEFTNGKEDFDHVVKIYRNYFDVISGSVTQLWSRTQWSVRLCTDRIEVDQDVEVEERLLHTSKAGRRFGVPTQTEQEDRGGELSRWHCTISLTCLRNSLPCPCGFV